MFKVTLLRFPTVDRGPCLGTIKIATFTNGHGWTAPTVGCARERAPQRSRSAGGHHTAQLG
eukprot:4708198-Prymnesium_polylepis.2